MFSLKRDKTLILGTPRKYMWKWDVWVINVATTADNHFDFGHVDFLKRLSFFILSCLPKTVYDTIKYFSKIRPIIFREFVEIWDLMNRLPQIAMCGDNLHKETNTFALIVVLSVQDLLYYCLRYLYCSCYGLCLVQITFNAVCQKF